MNLLSLDLEMNQPSGKIIQVGWTIGNPVTGYIYEDKGAYVHLFEPLNPIIANLCGITQQNLDNALPLINVYDDLVKDARKHNVEKQLLVWGEGDAGTLHNQLRPYLETWDAGVTWLFGQNTINAKTLYQSWKLKQAAPHLKGGLARACAKFGIPFQGRKHNAKDDAYNTFKVYHRLLQELK